MSLKPIKPAQLRPKAVLAEQALPPQILFHPDSVAVLSTLSEKTSKNNQQKTIESLEIRDYLWKPRSRFPFDLPLTNKRNSKATALSAHPDPLPKDEFHVPKY